VIARLHEADPRCAVARHPIEHVGHQRRTDAPVLCGRIDGDRPQPDDRRTFVDEIAADDPAVLLGDDAIETGIAAQLPQQTDRDVGIGEVGRKIMLRGDRLERVVTDPPGGRRIGGRERA